MNIKPIKTIHISDKVDFSGTANNQNHYILNGKPNKYYVFNKNFEMIKQFETPYIRTKLCTIHPTKEIITICDEDNFFHVVDFDGKDIWKKDGEYIAANWNLGGEYLYTLSRIDKNNLKLIIYDNFGEVIAQKDFEDELYESAALISAIPNSNEILLELMAGQDGCITIFVNFSDGEIIFRSLHEKYSYTDLSFNNEGTYFLCIENDESTIHHFSYPALKEIGIYEHDSEDGNLEYTLIHLEKTAIVCYDDNYYVLNLENMKISEDLIIEGHEPVPTREIYKNLDDDFLICDISYMCGAGDYIVGCAIRDNESDVVIMKKSDFIFDKQIYDDYKI